ncbi:MAG: hypothetical protein ACXABY_00245 [Candidatus Thorarchaeota archaeon]|jgi:hypothetical protein
MAAIYLIVFRDNGTPRGDLDPDIDFFFDAAAAVSLGTPPAVVQFGPLGFYKFTIDWDDSQYDGVDEIAVRIDGDTGGSLGLNDADRYIFGVATRVTSTIGDFVGDGEVTAEDIATAQDNIATLLATR